MKGRVVTDWLVFSFFDLFVFLAPWPLHTGLGRSHHFESKGLILVNVLLLLWYPRTWLCDASHLATLKKTHPTSLLSPWATGKLNDRYGIREKCSLSFPFKILGGDMTGRPCSQQPGPRLRIGNARWELVFFHLPQDAEKCIAYAFFTSFSFCLLHSVKILVRVCGGF